MEVTAMALYAFDGTGQEDQTDNERDTNVVRFARAYRGKVSYWTGVGTRGGFVGKVVGDWTGAGLHERVREAMKALHTTLQEGDTTIDVVGFSRGAAAALHFVNQVWKDVARAQLNTAPVRFLGLFDTVASTGPLPGRVDIALDLELPPNVVRCCHAMALDEGRASFHVHRMRHIKNMQGAPGVVEEVWFRGCHSDIGGGSRHENLANITLCWMMRRAGDVGVRFDKEEVQNAVDQRDPTAEIIRAKLDEGLLKRQVESNDRVHYSVQTRGNQPLWHQNPAAGCGIVGDAGESLGTFPTTIPWPRAIDWGTALEETAKS